MLFYLIINVKKMLKVGLTSTLDPSSRPYIYFEDTGEKTGVTNPVIAPALGGFWWQEVTS